jgi:hypothetical protein
LKARGILELATKLPGGYSRFKPDSKTGEQEKQCLATQSQIC